MQSHEPSSFVIIFAIAAIAPFICEWLPKVRLPLVVLEIGLGILVGPYVLNWAATGPVIQVFATFGMALLFFLAGFEINFHAIRGRPMTLTAVGWIASLGIGLGVGFVLQTCGVIQSGMIVGAALTTTALGTLMPILRDARELPTRFGAYAVAAGAMGEFGPILLIATVLSGGEGEHGGSLVLMIAFTGIIVIGTIMALKFRPPHIILVLQEKMHTSAQLPVRVAVLTLGSLVFIARQFGLDSILGALAAGVLVALTSPGEKGEELRHKLEGIGFGVFVPIFFVVTGMRYDLPALTASSAALLQLPMFLVLFLVVRGLPALLVRADLNVPSRVALALISATQLPLVVAIAEIGLKSGQLEAATAAALVGAGMVSVLVFPMAALAIRRRFQEVKQTTHDLAAEIPRPTLRHEFNLDLTVPQHAGRHAGDSRSLLD
jgi:Kef-type K+ transport system membrane component KefB